MLWYICSILSICVLGVAVKVLLDKNLGKKRMLSVVVCCLLATYTLYLPPLLSIYEPLVAISGGFANTMRVISLDADFLEASGIIGEYAPGTVFGTGYSLLLAMMHVCLPAVSAMTAVTMIIQWFAELQVKSIQKRKQPLHIFSTLNYESMILARDLRAHDKKCDILFLDNKADSDYSDLQQELHCNVLNEMIQDIKARADHRKVHYYCIGEDRERNLNDTLAIMAYMQNCTVKAQQNTHIYLFTTDPAAELIIDSVQKGRVNLSIVDRHRTAAYQLLQKYPLPVYAVGSKIHMLICGFNPMGEALVRAVSWIGQLYGYQLQVTVLGKNCEDRAEDFKINYPNLFCDRYDIRIFSYQNKAQFQQLLGEHAADANYLVVAEQSSEEAIENAIKLRRFYYKEDPAYKNAPPLFCYVENEDKAKAVAMLRTAEAKAERRMSYEIVPFGDVPSVFSYKNVTDSDLDKLSKNVHLVYEDIFSDGPIDVEGALERYNLFEVNKNSNRANALHIRYKLLMLGLDYTDDPEAEEVSLADYLSAEALENLTYAEHDRWMAFLDSEGWEGATVAQSKAYQASGISKGRHNCPLLKLHPYICPFEDLVQCSEDLGLPDSTVYDRDLISRIPDILHDKWNVLGMKYRIIKANTKHVTETGGTDNV